VPFSKTLHCTADLNAALAHSPHWLVCVPSQAFEAVMQQLQKNQHQPESLVWATKGLDPISKQFLHTRVQFYFPNLVAYGVLSGPSFAKEVARDCPTAVVLASESDVVLSRWPDWLKAPAFRVYSSHDVIGVELGGVLKNILAVAAGISDGLGLGANARAALLTRGMAEMMRFGTALGAQSSTLMGLSGLGDLLLTAMDDQSRNRRFGLLLAKNYGVDAALAEIGQVVECVHNVAEVMSLAAAHGIVLPITEQVYKVLHQGLSPRDAVTPLLARDQKVE